MNEEIFNELLERRVSKGFNRGLSMAILASILEDLDGDDLAEALSFEQFATDERAEEIADLKAEDDAAI